MRLFENARAKSPWILHFNSGRCNGCDIEIPACLTPLYDVERFGIVNVGNPKHADVPGCAAKPEAIIDGIVLVLQQGPRPASEQPRTEVAAG